MPVPPKAFISHTSSDKDRFVTQFTERLRANGVDAWLDRWEIQAGDSLVHKIFEQGIAHANAFIVVVSKNSINKPWVAEELSAGMVRKIQENCRLIPVVLDECEVPASLKHLLWVRIENPSGYDREFAQILNSIFNMDEKPPLGPAPGSASREIASYGYDLTKGDNLVFQCVCEEYLATGSRLISSESIFPEMVGLGLSEEGVSDSLEILENEGMLSVSRTFGGIHSIRVETGGLEIYFNTAFPDYDEAIKMVVAAMVNHDKLSSDELVDSTRIPLPVIKHILEHLDLLGHIKLSKELGGAMQVYRLTPQLKRMLK
jgi:hypothetical protein